MLALDRMRLTKDVIQMVNMEDCIRSISMDGELDTEPKYSVMEAAKMSNISAHTLRYYDDIGLLPFLHHEKGSKRLFSEADIQWLFLIFCLKNSDMSLADIKYYVELCLVGDETVAERAEIIQRQENVLTQKMADLQKQMQLLHFKQDFYQEKLHNPDLKGTL